MFDLIESKNKLSGKNQQISPLWINFGTRRELKILLISLNIISQKNHRKLAKNYLKNLPKNLSKTSHKISWKLPIKLPKKLAINFVDKFVKCQFNCSGWFWFVNVKISLDMGSEFSYFWTKEVLTHVSVWTLLCNSFQFFMLEKFILSKGCKMSCPLKRPKSQNDIFFWNLSFVWVDLIN